MPIESMGTKPMPTAGATGLQSTGKSESSVSEVPVDPRLREYLSHKDYCRSRYYVRGECTCGLAHLLGGGP